MSEAALPQQVVQVRTAMLLRGDSPRAAGEIREHAQLLAESDGPFPPVLVHRKTMRVIDGMHRLLAALLRGDATIAVEFFDGDEAEAFVAAVQANVTHGLPLTRTDREAAVSRLLSLFPERSDRWIADVAGLSASTVAVIRHRIGDDGVVSLSRIGRDGRVRPLNSAEARRVASEVIAERPGASLREVARLAGLSPATVRDVRERMRRGDDPVPSRERDSLHPRPGSSIRSRPAVRPGDVRDADTLLQILSRDPTLRLSESGRSLLRWLGGQARGTLDWHKVVDAIPPHCAYLVAELARGCAEEWSTFAGSLEQRLDDLA